MPLSLKAPLQSSTERWKPEGPGRGYYCYCQKKNSSYIESDSQFILAEIVFGLLKLITGWLLYGLRYWPSLAVDLVYLSIMHKIIMLTKTTRSPWPSRNPSSVLFFPDASTNCPSNSSVYDLAFELCYNVLNIFVILTTFLQYRIRKIDQAWKWRAASLMYQSIELRGEQLANNQNESRDVFTRLVAANDEKANFLSEVSFW